jgi:DNA-directed RNA polymerase specialized sigma24 family protein
MSELFPTTHSTWLIDRSAHAPDEARAHVMSRYFDPLCAYARASSLRAVREPTELVNDFFAARLSDDAYLARWSTSGLPLRRWLVNGLITHARNRAAAELRRQSKAPATDPATLASAVASPEPAGLLALERAWAMRVMIEAHDRVRSEFDADGKSAWWELFRLHSMQGMSYAEACRITGIAPSNATNVHRSVALRLRDALRAILEREGIRPEEIARELALMQDMLG